MWDRLRPVRVSRLPSVRSLVAWRRTCLLSLRPSPLRVVAVVRCVRLVRRKVAILWFMAFTLTGLLAVGLCIRAEPKKIGTCVLARKRCTPKTFR